MGEEIAFAALIDSPGPRQDSSRMVSKFTLQSELNWILHYLPDKKIKKKLRKATGLSQIWPLIVDHLEAINFDIKIIKKLIPENMIHAITNYQKLGIRELIYYLNVSRTFINAREFYIPGNKIETEVHLFKASLEETHHENCSCYSKQPIKVY